MKKARIESITNALRFAFDEAKNSATSMEILVAVADLSIDVGDNDLRKALVELVYEMNGDLIPVTESYNPEVLFTEDELFLIPNIF